MRIEVWRSLRGVAVFLAVLAVVPCRAPVRAESLLPLRTETAVTLPAGTAEAGLGASYFRNDRFPYFTGAGALKYHHLVSGPEFGFHIAAGRWAEIQATFEMLSIDERTTDGQARRNVFGPGDARLFTKVHVISERELWPAVGIRFGTKLPNANLSNRLGTDETDFGIEALASKNLGSMSVHANLGMLLLGNPGPMLGAPANKGAGQDDLVNYSVAVVLPPITSGVEGAASLRFVAEVIGLAGSHYGNDRTSVRAGIQMRQGGLTVYSGASAGLITASENFGVTGGLLYAFELDRFFGPRD